MHEAVLAAQLSSSLYLYDIKLLTLVKQYGSLENLYQMWQSKSKELSLELNKKLAMAWESTKLERMQQLLDEHKIFSIVLGSDQYPELLSHIADPPYVLYYKGNLEALNQRCISMVGTRRISNYGKRAVDYLMSGLKGYNVSVISGLALGIDAAVHQASIDNNLLTVAVIGGGLDRYEPLTNAKLGERIETHGCLISEYPPGVRPEKHHFLARNRIIAGLSELTIVVEGEMKSGSLVTARDALSYGRDVGAVPGDIFLLSSSGPYSLIKDGAFVITEASTILELLNISVVAEVSESLLPEPFISLLMSPQSVDTLLDKSGLSLRELQVLLTDWELAGIIAVTPGGEYYRK